MILKKKSSLGYTIGRNNVNITYQITLPRVRTGQSSKEPSSSIILMLDNTKCLKHDKPLKLFLYV